MASTVSNGNDRLRNGNLRRLTGLLPIRPFPSSCLPPHQSESKYDVFVMVISSTLHMNEN